MSAYDGLPRRTREIAVVGLSSVAVVGLSSVAVVGLSSVAVGGGSALRLGAARTRVASVAAERGLELELGNLRAGAVGQVRAERLG